MISCSLCVAITSQWHHWRWKTRFSLCKSRFELFAATVAYDIESFYRWLTSFGISCFLMLLLKLDSLNISLFERSYNRCWLFDFKVYALVLVLLLLLEFSLLFLYISNYKVLFCPNTFVIFYSFPTLDIITSFTFGAYTGCYFFSRWGNIVVLEENRLSSC